MNLDKATKGNFGLTRAIVVAWDARGVLISGQVINLGVTSSVMAKV